MKIGAIVAAIVVALLVLAAVPFVAVVIFFMTLTNSGSSCGGPATLTADGSPTILGPATLTAAQIAGWWQAHGHGQSTPVGVDIATLAGWYIDHGTAEGVRGDYAFAQAIEETTQGGVGFNSPAAHRNNFAGIGITGSGVNGYDFATPEAGVVAQLQLLKEVVDGNSVPFAEPRVAPTWGGRSASTWAGLAGNWATAPNYWDCHQIRLRLDERRPGPASGPRPPLRADRRPPSSRPPPAAVPEKAWASPSAATSARCGRSSTPSSASPTSGAAPAPTAGTARA